MMRFAVLVCLVVSGGFGSRVYAAGQNCEQLAQLELPNTTITSAQTVAAGAFVSPEGMSPYLVAEPSFYKQLPTFCRVIAEDKPSADSDIKIEVWMPANGWNGKFRGQGNGGFAGEMDYRGLGIAILQGYASAATDTGHAGHATDAAWAKGHPEKVIDYAHRAIHDMTVIGKATVKAFYGDALKYSYFGSCSNGGREALMEAQRYPEDYNGILAGAPANHWTHLLSSALWDAQVTTLDAESYIPSSKVPAIAQAVVAACDAKDGVKDGILNDPRQCHFDPATMLCKEGNADSCLTQPQVTALKKLYAGLHDSKGKEIFPGFVPGGEEGPGGWGRWITGDAPGQALLFAFGSGFFGQMVYEKEGWDYRKANLDDAVAASDQKFANILNATDPNMKAFEAHGGKLILYHGWNDPGISPLSTVKYYEKVLEKMGKRDADSFVRLYMMPGMQHCGGGPGPNVFGQSGMSRMNDAQHNIYVALEEWVEKGTAPGAVIAAKLEGDTPMGKLIMTRPICMYPETAKYKGSGDTNDTANFVCAKAR
jgi:Tannase and feruloyl esterase